jgi:hypothetical protein
MSNPKSALTAAVILSLTMIGSAAALPAGNLASTAKASAGIQTVQTVQWVCGPRGCFRRPIWGWRRPIFNRWGGSRVVCGPRGCFRRW